MGHYVYKYVYNNEIIYIGKNDTELPTRLSQHGKSGDNIPEEGWDEINNSEVYYCKLANKVMSDVVESELIRRHKPKYNKAKMSEWSGINFGEPNWIKYKTKEDFEKEEGINKCKNDIGKLKKEILDLRYEEMRLYNDVRFLRFERKNCAFSDDALKASIKTRNKSKSNKCIENERIYSYDEIFMFYDYLLYKSKIRFYSNMFDEKGNVVSTIQIWCSNDKINYKIKYYNCEQQEYMDYTLNSKNIVNDDSIKYVCFGFRAESNDCNYINKIINLAKIENDLKFLNSLKDQLNVFMKIKNYSDENMSLETFLNNIKNYAKEDGFYDFYLHNDKEKRKFRLYFKDGSVDEKNLSTEKFYVETKMNISCCSDEKMERDIFFLRYIDDFKDYKFDAVFNREYLTSQYENDIKFYTNKIEEFRKEHIDMYTDES